MYAASVVYLLVSRRSRRWRRRARDAPPLDAAVARRHRASRSTESDAIGRADSVIGRESVLTESRTQVPGHVPGLGINLQQPGSAQDAGTAPPPPAPKKEPEPEPEPEVERTPEEQKAYDQKQLALAHKAKGNAAYKKRDFDAALKHYDDAIAADPETSRTEINAGPTSRRRTTMQS